jgi:hypothetical protein
VSPDGRAEAVVDRIVDGVAVLLVDREEEHHIPADRLPDEVGAGSILLISVGSDGEVTIHGVDVKAEQQRRQAMDDRLERLRTDRHGGRFRG